MLSLTAIALCNIIHGKLISGPAERVISGGVCTDSRRLPDHAVFFALSGEHFDGNAFAATASHQAAAVVVSNVIPDIDPSCAVIMVPNTLQALQQLATWWRTQLNLTVVGLTGSNGKTSTKDFTAALLAQRYRTVATAGNLNNHIGVPMSILQASATDQAAVWEIGMNHAGELAPLCDMIRPQIGIITSIGTSHIEFLGSQENIAREKCTLARCLPASGHMIFPAECTFADMIRQSTQATCIDCGINTGIVQASEPVFSPQGMGFTLTIPGLCQERILLPVYGRHMVQNALLAAACAWVTGLTAEQIMRGLNSVQLTQGRLHCRHIDDILVIDDTYNANPDSMQAALRTMAALPCPGKRIAVLGKMGELGDFAARGYRQVAQTAQELHIDYLLGVGEEAAAMPQALVEQQSATFGVSCSTAQQAAAWLTQHMAPGDLVLFKGSRSARMEQVLAQTFPTLADTCTH